MDKQNSLDAHCHSKGRAPVEVKERKEMEEMKVSEVMFQKDQERVREELKDEEMSLKEEQVEEPVQADPLGIRDESSDDSASPSERAGIWIEELLIDVETIFTARENMDKQNSLDAHCHSKGRAPVEVKERKEMEEMKVSEVMFQKDQERVREELKDEETSLKEEQVEEPVQADPLDLLLNTVLANSLSKLEEKEATAISTHFKNSGDAQHQDYELLLMKLKRKWARIFSEMNAVSRPLVHPPTSSLHNDAPVDLHLHLNTTVDSTLKEELKQMDMKRKWMKRLREREELKNLTDSSDERPADVSHTEKSELLLPTNPPINVSKLEDKEASAISSHLKNSGQAQHQDHELLLMKMKRKWARIFSETSACKTTAACKASEQAIQETLLWCKDLLLNTVLANSLSKLEEKEATAISTHFKNSGDAQHQDYELLLMKLKRKWAGKFSEMNTVSRPLVHPPTSSLHNDTPVDLHLHLNTTVDSTLKEELKQMDMKRKWMKRLRERGGAKEPD
ncbi:hypothetical protein SRHO_G00009550 [Serrasalmus rhombeus]